MSAGSAGSTKFRCTKSSIAFAGSRVIPSNFTCARRFALASLRMRLAGQPDEMASSVMLSIFIWYELLKNAIIITLSSNVCIYITNAIFMQRIAGACQSENDFARSGVART